MSWFPSGRCRQAAASAGTDAAAAAALPLEAAGKAIEIWFQDETRIGQQGTPSYEWGLCGSRLPAVRDNRHDTTYIFGTVCRA